VEFKGSHFEKEIILWSVRWYAAYPLSYRQLEEMMCGVESEWNSYRKISITVLMESRTLWKVMIPGTVVTTWICKDSLYNLP
jgi:hypothetical protein